jgi:PIN domain nuclease of toxin-antitoxin system
MLNLDTHIVIHAVDGSLTETELAALNDDAGWGISAIVLWEITKLHEKGRIRFGLDAPQMARAIARLHIWPITSEICLNLRRLDFRSDPADELIAATSLTYDVALVTRDSRVRATSLFLCIG